MELLSFATVSPLAMNDLSRAPKGSHENAALARIRFRSKPLEYINLYIK